MHILLSIEFLDYLRNTRVSKHIHHRQPLLFDVVPYSLADICHSV